MTSRHGLVGVRLFVARLSTQDRRRGHDPQESLDAAGSAPAASAAKQRAGSRVGLEAHCRRAPIVAHRSSRVRIQKDQRRVRR